MPGGYKIDPFGNVGVGVSGGWGVNEKGETGIALGPQEGKTANFLKALLNGNVRKIKLIGDSITEGVGATNHTVPGGNPIIFNDGAGNIFREGDYTSRCWANMFREYIQANYPTIPFINAGIGGKSAEFANANKRYWVSNTEDVVFVMLGTNDRQEGGNPAKLEANLREFLAYVAQYSELMIVMSPNPTLNDYDAAGVRNPIYTFDMGTIDRITTKVCSDSGYTHISHYRTLLDYARTTKTPLSRLLQSFAIGSHPLDSGYFVMWQTMQQELGLIDHVKNWTDLSDRTVVADPTTITAATPITAFATTGLTYNVEVGATHPDLANFFATPGTLTTYRGATQDLYSWQRYLYRGGTQQWQRAWDVANTKWGPWLDITPGFMNITDTAQFTTATAVTAAVFAPGRCSYADIPTTHADISNFPEGSAGTLITYRAYLNQLHSYQQYNPRTTSRVYRRTWNAGTSVWNAWELFQDTMAVTALPAASSAYRGSTKLVMNGAGVADQLFVCRKNAANAYEWVQITT